MLAGVIAINPLVLAKGAAFVIAGLALLYFAWVFLAGGLDSTETNRVAAIFATLFTAAAVTP